MPKVENGYLLDDSELIPYGKANKNQRDNTKKEDVKKKNTENDNKGKN